MTSTSVHDVDSVVSLDVNVVMLSIVSPPFLSNFNSIFFAFSEIFKSIAAAPSVSLSIQCAISTNVSYFSGAPETTSAIFCATEPSTVASPSSLAVISDDVFHLSTSSLVTSVDDNPFPSSNGTKVVSTYSIVANPDKS